MRCVMLISTFIDGWEWPMTDQTLQDEVRRRYAAAAVAAAGGGDALATVDANADCCSGGGAVDAAFGASLYSAEQQQELPAQAVAASLGCGNPFAVAELRTGERVLDLGSGGGIDVLLSARRVGPTGFAYGVDMTGDGVAGPRECRSGRCQECGVPGGRHRGRAAARWCR